MTIGGPVTIGDAFGGEFGRTFSFLAEAHGFSAPSHDGTVGSLHSAELALRVAYDPRSKYLTTAVTASVDGREVTAELPCLYEHAGLGASERIRHLALGPAGLTAALLSHAAAVRELLPALTGRSRDRLLLACRGR